MHLQSSSKYLELFKSAGKSFNLPGHVSHSASTRGGVSRCGLSGTWRTRKVSGGWLSVWALGTCGELGRHPEGGSRFGLPGHMANSEGFQRVLSVLGFRD